MSRKKARIAREQERKLAELAKSARLREKLPPSGPRFADAPPTAKTVRAGANPGSIYAMRMEWSADEADLEGHWSWGVARQWSETDWTTILQPKLGTFMNLTWGEIDRASSDSGHKMHHSMDTDVICEEAQIRMIEIERHADTIFRFRLGNRRRLWGHRIVNRFDLLWYDPTHMIYPTDAD